MKLYILTEDTALEGFECEHGLSVFIEANGKRILFDTGATGLFLHNAEKLGVDIAGVDLCVVSHGHYDHGGGLETFLANNEKARVYIHHQAKVERYSRRPDGSMGFDGVRPEGLDQRRIVYTQGDVKLDDNALLFSNVRGNELVSASNGLLMEKRGEEYVQDDFGHEQNMILKEGEKTVLFTGCAHRGIVNIVDEYIARYGKPPYAVIGGFHLSNPDTGAGEAGELVTRVSKKLENGALYYTGHCTGSASFDVMKQTLGKRVERLRAGMVITL